MALSVGELADAAGVNVATVRYYERRGIIPDPPRTASGYRRYDPQIVERIRFIKRAQSLGFTLDEIVELVDLRVDVSAACAAVEEVAQAKLTDVETKIEELERLRTILVQLVRSCHTRPAAEDCPILTVLEREESVQ